MHTGPAKHHFVWRMGLHCFCLGHQTDQTSGLILRPLHIRRLNRLQKQRNFNWILLREMRSGAMGHQELQKALRNQHQNQVRKPGQLRFHLSVLPRKEWFQRIHNRWELHEQRCGAILKGSCIWFGFGDPGDTRIYLHQRIFQRGLQILLWNQRRQVFRLLLF